MRDKGMMVKRIGVDSFIDVPHIDFYYNVCVPC